MAEAEATSSQQAPVEWNVGELVSHIRDVATKENTFDNEKLKPMADMITTLAENIKKTGPQHDAKVARLRVVLQDVADVNTEVRAHVDALGQAQGQLSMEAEPTDFAAVLADAAAGAADAHSGEAAEMLAHFDQAVTGGAEGIEDDDEVQVDRGNDLAPNAACPITSKGILEIEEPVQDQKGFVYEKVAIVGHIRRNGVGDQVNCPHHGTNHMVSLNNLKEARAVVRAQRSKQRRAELQSQIPGAESEDDDVLDID